MTVSHDVLNPATEELVRTIDMVGVEETDAAIARSVEVGPASREVRRAARIVSSSPRCRASGDVRSASPSSEALPPAVGTG